MDWNSLVGPAVIAALVSGIVAIVGFRYSAATAKSIHSERLEFDAVQSERKFQADKELAERKFEFDKAQHLHKRKFELAERLLADVYQFQQIVCDARRTYGFTDEGGTRKKPADEPSEIADLRNTYFAPVERLNKEHEFLAAFFAKRYSASAHFGHRAKVAFEHCTLAINAIHVASHMLIMTAGNQNNTDDFINEMTSDLWFGRAQTLQREDKVDVNINLAVTIMETICRPVLVWREA